MFCVMIKSKRKNCLQKVIFTNAQRKDWLLCEHYCPRWDGWVVGKAEIKTDLVNLGVEANHGNEKYMLISHCIALLDLPMKGGQLGNSSPAS